MDKCVQSIQKAQQYLQTSDHILTTTYPIVQEPKVLVASLENIFLSVTNVLGAILYYERLKKRIPPFHNNFESKFNMFQLRIKELHPYTDSDVTFIDELYNLIVFHQNSSVEFSKKSQFVMCSDSYNIQKLNPELIKSFIQKAKLFFEKTTKIIDGEKW